MPKIRFVRPKVREKSASSKFFRDFGGRRRRGGGCGPLRFRSEPQIHDSKFKIQNYNRAADCGGHADSATNCGPPLPGGCGPPMPAASNPFEKSPQPSGRACGAPKGAMKNEELKMRNYFGLQLAKGTHERTCGREMRACAGRSCGPLRFHLEPQIQNSEWQIRAAACGGHARSGLADASSGPPRREAAARSVLTDRFKPETSPQPSGWGCDAKEQPSARPFQV